MQKIRALFFWTPGLSATILEYLTTQTDAIEIVGIVTNPDTVWGRGHELMASPVAQFARKNTIQLLQPEKVRKNEEFLTQVRALKPDICLVVAYGKILPQELLDIPPMGFLNVHSSLLPKYRGAAPIQHALLDGEKTTGLTVMQLDLGMDEGDILLQETWEVLPTDTTGTLYEKKGKRGGPLLMEAIKGILNKTIIPQKQDHSGATYSQKIEKKDGELNISWTVDEAYHRWQAYTPWPGLYTQFNGVKVTLLEIEKIQTVKDKIQNEGFFIVDKFPAIQFSDGFLVIKKIHPAGKKPMSGEDFVRGFMQKK